MNKNQITNIEVKKNNRNRIFRYICKKEKTSNPEISYDLKMSLPTVTQNTKELIEKGLIQEVGELQSTGGRRAKALSVISNSKLAIGLDITKNHVGILLTNLKGEIIKYERFNNPFKDEDNYYIEINKKIKDFLSEIVKNDKNILGMGISFPGIINLEKEMVSYSHMLGLKALPFNSISKFFSYPCYFINDANAGAYAEGINKEQKDEFFYLSLSNTVGGAIFNSNELIYGKNYRSGEVGHMTIVPNGINCYCGKSGCLDAYCSAKRLSDITDGNLDLFFKRLENNDKNIKEVWDDYTTYLSIAINNINMILDCDVIIGGYVGSFIEPHIDSIKKKVAKRNTFSDDSSFIKNCSYKVATAALGAALNVIEKFIKQV
ncbi:MarR family transcriptional regulator [Oceanotoga teriensis]|jgi:predicted NBD/HSP70 family sugar kinase|uniref:MarR family transcriptional regulator n=1 Tax=Oceanotoga teriensis TaxID=515440 RepID=A0AA45C524_9BACT|nr:ROK family transcriptional regulator [Oceanotoga teriensis]PWJ87890.1 MarR family transcriptional regulator [Oceanotoga teriensis]